MFEENFVPLAPINFFQVGVDCLQHHAPLTNANFEKYLLPDTSMLCKEHHFADVALAWHPEGIEAFVYVKQAIHQVKYPDVSGGDSVELFFDTRDVKTSGFNTRFCHHFFFLPEAVEGQQAGEITRFRTEDKHELCNPNDLKVTAHTKPRGYTLSISIPQQCLQGYDPAQFDRLGFTYRINRASGSPQHFSVVSNEFQIEQQPSLWSTLKLIKA